MWFLYVLSVIGAVALIALLGWGVSKVIDLFDKIDSIDSELRSINNYISDLSTRMDTAENTIRGMKKEDAENA